MEMGTTECGLQLYDGGTIDGRDYPTHHGAPYGPYAAPALEAQSWPGSLAQTHFPDIILRPGRTLSANHKLDLLSQADRLGLKLKRSDS